MSVENPTMAQTGNVGDIALVNWQDVKRENNMPGMDQVTTFLDGSQIREPVQDFSFAEMMQVIDRAPIDERSIMLASMLNEVRK